MNDLRSDGLICLGISNLQSANEPSGANSDVHGTSSGPDG